MDPGYFDINREQNPREKASLPSKIAFWYTRRIFAKGLKGDLDITDVYRCTPGQMASPKGDVLFEKWKEEISSKEGVRKPSLMRAIIKIWGAKFIIFNIFFGVSDTVLKLSIPLCLEGLINYFSASQTENGVTALHARLYALGLVGFMVISAVMIHPLLLWLLHLSLKVRVACSSLIYRKLLRLDLTAGGKASEGLAGHVVTLLTTDAQRFDMACLFLVDLVKTPLESILIIYFMYNRLGYAALIGVAFLLSFIPLQAYLGKISGKLRRKTAVRTDHRIRLMNEVIQSIEAIKMYGWEEAFGRIIGDARKKEMQVIKKISWLRAVMISCVKLNTKIAIFLSIISFVAFKNELTASKAFVIYSFYDILKTTLVDFLPLAITFTIEAFVSVKRMQEFLLLPEVDNRDGVDLEVIHEVVKANGVNGVFNKMGSGQQAYIDSDTNLEPAKPTTLISMKDFSAHWPADGGDKMPALIDVNLTIKAESFTTVVGTVGAGKSTLLMAMLREVAPSSGDLSVNGRVAYAAQDPWLFEASVRQNILFGQEYDHMRYRQVVKCCQLENDMKILAHGHKTIVGERGSSLSGGQRARISLARCVYQRADVYLLDDPLAAVDAKVAQAIYEECIRGFLRYKATVLVTHHAQYARHADAVCVMRAGKIVAQGTYRELINTEPEFTRLIEMCEREDEKQKTYEMQESVVLYNASVKTELSKVDAIISEQSHKLRTQRSVSVASQLSAGNMDMDTHLDPAYEGETQKHGAVDSSVYLEYIKSGGSRLTMVVLVGLFTISQIFYASTDYWLKEWVNIEEQATASEQVINGTSGVQNGTTTVYTHLPANRFGLTREQCVYVYATLIGVSAFFTWNKLVLFYNTCIKASINLHDSMLRGVTLAPMWFFHHNPSGRILNRFSKDMGVVDTWLPVVLVDCFGFFLEVVSALILVSLVNWWLLLPTALVATALWYMRKLFLTTSRDLKRIEAIARSQSLNHCAATVSGLTTIRSAGDQQRTLAREFDSQQDLHSSAYGLVLVTNRAFGCWMDMICCVYLGVVTFSFFLFAGNGETSGGLVGLAITQVISLVGMCQYGMRQTAEVENQMTSVERMLEYKNLPSEKPLEPDHGALLRHSGLDMEAWPSKGEIVFEDVSLQYEKAPKSPTSITKSLTPQVGVEKDPQIYAIKGVNFVIRPAEKVAVVGRTGAGKSSLIAALFRLSSTTGSVRVDGLTAEEVGLRQWRSRLCALPQRPALFASSLRDNLDPARKYSDAQIYAALDQVELRELVSSMPAGLTTKVGDGGGNLSSGQRQLLCLARAALAGATVLVLDEATANVDTETDKQVQGMLRAQFGRCSVLTIAHRLHTVMDYDRVIVMDQGRVVESGHPHELLTKGGEGRTDATPRRSLLSKSQTPLAIPENFTYEQNNVAEHNETLVLSRDRIRTYSNRSEVNEQESTATFKGLVDQSGPETARVLYKMAEDSYNKLMAAKEFNKD